MKRLIVAPGIQEFIGTKSVCSNDSYEPVDHTWETLKAFKQSTALPELYWHGMLRGLG